MVEDGCECEQQRRMVQRAGGVGVEPEHGRDMIALDDWQRSIRASPMSDGPRCVRDGERLTARVVSERGDELVAVGEQGRQRRVGEQHSTERADGEYELSLAHARLSGVQRRVRGEKEIGRATGPRKLSATITQHRPPWLTRSLKSSARSCRSQRTSGQGYAIVP